MLMQMKGVVAGWHLVGRLSCSGMQVLPVSIFTVPTHWPGLTGPTHEAAIVSVLDLSAVAPLQKLPKSWHQAGSFSVAFPNKKCDLCGSLAVSIDFQDSGALEASNLLHKFDSSSNSSMAYKKKIRKKQGVDEIKLFRAHNRFSLQILQRIFGFWYQDLMFKFFRPVFSGGCPLTRCARHVRHPIHQMLWQPAHPIHSRQPQGDATQANNIQKNHHEISFDQSWHMIHHDTSRLTPWNTIDEAPGYVRKHHEAHTHTHTHSLLHYTLYSPNSTDFHSFVPLVDWFRSPPKLLWLHTRVLPRFAPANDPSDAPGVQNGS